MDNRGKSSGKFKFHVRIKRLPEFTSANPVDFLAPMTPVLSSYFSNASPRNSEKFAHFEDGELI